MQNHELLVDGGVISNIPIDVMERSKRGPNIAIDLSVESEYSVAGDAMPSASKFLASRRLPWRQTIQAPTRTGLILKIATLGNQTAAREVSADLHINPGLAGFDLLDWGRIHQLVDVGYHQTLDDIEAWPDLSAVHHRTSRFDSSGTSLASLSFGRHLEDLAIESVSIGG